MMAMVVVLVVSDHKLRWTSEIHGQLRRRLGPNSNHIPRHSTGTLSRSFFFVGRPNVERSSGELLFCRRLFFLANAFSELPRPIVVKLCRMIGNWLNFINEVQKFEGLPQNIWEQKTCKISVSFVPLQMLIANISGARQHIQSRKTSQTIPPAFNKQSPVNLGPIATWNYM